MVTAIDIYANSADILLLSLLLILPLLLVVISFRQKWGISILAKFIYIIAIFFCSSLVTFIINATYVNKVSINNSKLNVNASVFNLAVENTSGCDVLKTYSEKEGFNLAIRTFGISLVKYKAGWFLDKNNREVFVLISGNNNLATLLDFNGTKLLIENNEQYNVLLTKLCN